jgi:hypothetical protein
MQFAVKLPACFNRPEPVLTNHRLSYHRDKTAHTQIRCCVFHPNAWNACAGYQAEPTMNDTALAIPYALKVRNTPLLAPFIYKMHLFAKTGSGQTRRKS